MSVEAIAWALAQNLGDPTRKLVLIGLANHAHRDGTEAWASNETIAEYANCSRRTVQRHLQALVDSGVIARGDQSAVERVRADRRPVVYDIIAMRGDTVSRRDERGDTEDERRGIAMSRRDPDGVSPVTERGDIAMSHKPSNKPTTKTSSSSVDDVRTTEAEFEEDFWPRYRRKVGKGAALKAYKAARKKASRELILSALDAYRAATDHKDMGYIKHPSTWLNAESWHDDPEALAPPPSPPSLVAINGGIARQTPDYTPTPAADPDKLPWLVAK
jgi:hypothetical protein